MELSLKDLSKKKAIHVPHVLQEKKHDKGHHVEKIFNQIAGMKKRRRKRIEKVKIPAHWKAKHSTWK